MNWTAGKTINLIAAACGSLGTLFLYRGSFAFQQLGAWTYEQFVDDMHRRNRRRKIFQRVGLGLIFAGFALGGVAQFFE